MPAPTPRTEPAWLRCRRRVFMLCNAFGMNREDRLELASVFLDRNVDSYSDLDPAELSRLRDGLECAAIVCMFQMQRRSGDRR